MVDLTSHNVYVLVEFDSYDGDMNDVVKGQIEETLETNNVAVDGPWQITNLDCSGVIDITQNRRRKENPCNVSFTLPETDSFTQSNPDSCPVEIEIGSRDLYPSLCNVKYSA